MTARELALHAIWFQLSLPDRQRRLVATVCGPMLRAYGYPLNPADLLSQEA